MKVNIFLDFLELVSTFLALHSALVSKSLEFPLATTKFLLIDLLILNFLITFCIDYYFLAVTSLPLFLLFS